MSAQVVPLPHSSTVVKHVAEVKRLLLEMQEDRDAMALGFKAPGYDRAEGRYAVNRYHVDRIRKFLYQPRRVARNYGITEEQYWGLLDEQDCRCAICSAEFGPDLLPVVDHNHTSGAVRGLLCGKCNTALGMFQDSPDLLDAALVYLEVRGCYGKNTMEVLP